jgi:hypothetical protein
VKAYLGLAIGRLDCLEEAGDHFLYVLALDFEVVPALLHEEPGEGGGVVLEVALQVGDAVDGGAPELGSS